VQGPGRGLMGKMRERTLNGKIRQEPDTKKKVSNIANPTKKLPEAKTSSLKVKVLRAGRKTANQRNKQRNRKRVLSKGSTGPGKRRERSEPQDQAPSLGKNKID